MEHRWYKRLPIAINVLLYHNSIPVVRCKTRDIGASGLFVETGPVTYATNTMLEVEFVVESHQGHQRYRLPSMVVQRANNGMGLVFSKAEPNVFQALQQKIPSTNYRSQTDSLTANNTALLLT